MVLWIGFSKKVWFNKTRKRKSGAILAPRFEKGEPERVGKANGKKVMLFPSFSKWRVQSMVETIVMTGNNSGMWVIIGAIILVAAGVGLATLAVIRKRRM